MPGPSWFPTRPSWMPAWDEVYKTVVPGLWPKRMVKAGGNLAKDLEVRSQALSWVREALDWLLHAFFPSKDANALFLDRWETSLDIAPAGTVAERVNRIESSVRQRHTMTEAQIQAIFARCWNHDDPAQVSVRYPVASGSPPGDVATVNTLGEITGRKNQNFMHIYPTQGCAHDGVEPNYALADDLVRRLCPAWQRWTIGPRDWFRYGDGGTHVGYKWGRGAVGEGP
jgi:hypothetical protein